jgi:S1 RNA binding domain protein
MTDEITSAPLAVEELSIGAAVSGKVTYLAVYGAMIDIGTGQEALLHISQLGRSDFRNIEDVVKVGDEIEAYVLKIDDEGHVALTTERPPALPWNKIERGPT